VPRLGAVMCVGKRADTGQQYNHGHHGDHTSAHNPSVQGFPDATTSRLARWKVVP
jgi:hypothetical protein